MKNKTKHIIKTIEPGSIAEELELEPGDELLRVNGEIIEDVFDYHFQTNDTYLELTIRKKDGEEWDLEIEKEYDEEIGITFENEFIGSVPFLQQQLHFLLHRSDAAGNASHLVF